MVFLVDLDYIVFGLVYLIQIKVFKWVVQGVEKVCDWKICVGDMLFVVIGGINLEWVGKVFQYGVDSIVVISDVIKYVDLECWVWFWVMVIDSLCF